MQNVRQWLDSLGLGNYADAFEQNAIDWELLPKLSAEELKEMGVSALGHRKRILEAAAAIGAVAPVVEPKQPSPAPERRQLTVMFCDLANSTAFSELLDPEEFREVILAYQEVCARVIKTHGGFIARFLGDGILAYFGYPQAHEDDAARGVRAGLDVADAVAGLEETMVAPENINLAVRVGISTGPVVVGDIVGEGASQEKTVLGETPNVAARLQTIASPGDVVIGPGTQVLVESSFRLEFLGPQELKGISMPVPAYRVVGEDDVASRFEVTTARSFTPLVGRDAEIVLLKKRWEQALEGQGQVVLLSGEPGVGKTRVVRGLQEALAPDLRNRVIYFCSAHHQHSVLRPVIEQLNRVLQLSSADDDKTKLDRLDATLESLGFRDQEAACLLASLLSLPTDRYSRLSLNPQQRRERLLLAMVAVVERMSERAPVLFVVEDLHWIDPSTHELLDLAVAQLRQARVLMLLTARPEFESAWRGYAHVTTLSLNHLSRQDSRAIVAGLLSGRKLADETIEQIVERTDGVPLYVEELTKVVLESSVAGESVPDEAESTLARSTTIPTSLQDSLMARLDRLGSAKELAQLGATLGRTFTHELLAAVWPNEEDKFADSLSTLLAADLIYRQGQPPDATYLFKHALIQDAAYQSLLKSTRQRYHRRIAETLVEHFPSLAEIEPEVVAHHFGEAGLAERAVIFWQRAGLRAWERFAYREAIAHLEHGLELIPMLPTTPESERQELELRVTLGGALGTIKGQAAPEVEQNYIRARDLCEHIGDQSRLFTVMWGLWMYSQQAGQMRRAQGLAESVLELAEGQSDSEYRLQAHHAIWTTAQRVAEFGKCLEHAERGVSLYDMEQHRHHAFAYGGHDPGVCAYCVLGGASWAVGRVDRALDHVYEAKRLAMRLADPFSRVFAQCFVAQVHQLRGEAEQCLQQATELTSLCAEHGFALFGAQGNILRGWALMGVGESDEGIQVMRDGLSDYRATGARVRYSYFLSLLAEKYCGEGRLDEAIAMITEARDALETSGERTFETEVYRVHGELLSATHDEVAAEQALKNAISLARKRGAKTPELRAATSLARLRQRQGNFDQVRDLLAPVYEWFTEGFETADLREAKALLEG